MGAPQRYRAQSPDENEVIAILSKGRSIEARIDAQGQVVRAVQEGITAVSDQALFDTAWLARRAEQLAGNSPVLQAALASVLDQALLEVLLAQHRGSEKVRHAGDC
jgi:hypothetical protein